MCIFEYYSARSLAESVVSRDKLEFLFRTFLQNIAQVRANVEAEEENSYVHTPVRYTTKRASTVGNANVNN